ncbi:MAG: cytochrome c oxidase assembly protein [Marinovum algicola]|uniref:cytochrome c oxidase assembly protein n=1 Tax=Marinovum algicola TaxID=42444 RepID=UPI0032EF301B
MKSIESRNRRTLLFAALIVASMSVLVVYSPTLYRMFCDLTGFGGTVRRAAAPAPGGAASSETITVNFDANVDPKLPWEFRPEQRSVRTRFGEPTRVNYFARNNSDETVVARATFNVTPFKAAPYFFKIECFCFTEERLGPGESALMPLVLYVDEQLLKDESTQEVRTITLSYTFYKQENLSADEVEAARDLKAGSREIDTKLDKADTVEFDNDAPRR